MLRRANLVLDRASAHFPPIRISAFPTVRGRDLVLGMLVLATLMMPVNYRAGTDLAHSHSVFQSIIDTVTGHTHHHANEPTVTKLAPSPFAPAALPLASAAQPAPTSSEGDVASILASAPAPVSPFSAMQLLGLLVAGLMMMAAFARHWPVRLRPSSLSLPIEIPPPRAA